MAPTRMERWLALSMHPGGDVVVVLTFHGKDDTLRCLESLASGSPEVGVVLVDNGSEDGVLAEAAARWDGITTIQTGANLGFAGGMNRGLDEALGHQPRSVTVLNNDTVVPPGAITRLADEAAGSACLVSPEVRYLADPEKIWFSGGTIDAATGLARHLSAEEVTAAKSPAGGSRSTQILAGCCLTASAQTWRRLAGFDDAYFLLFEDSDLSVRALSAGISLVVAQDVTILHQVSASFTGSHSYLGGYYYARNALNFSRSLGGRTVLRRLRLARRHLLAQVTGPMRRHDGREAARRLLVLGIAVRDHLSRRTGEAPRSLRERAATWA